MNVLLINPPYNARLQTPLHPCHLMYIAQAAEQVGHEVDLLDLPCKIIQEDLPNEVDEKFIEDCINAKEYGLIGIGGIVISYRHCEKLVKLIKKIRPDIPIIIGGSVGLPLMKTWQEHAPVDFICEGDGEIVIQRLLQELSDGGNDYSHIPGLYYRTGDGSYQGIKAAPPLDLDYLPFLEFEKIDLEFYTSNIRNWLEFEITIDSSIFQNQARIFPLFMSRGCPFHCTFCYHYDSTYRKHSPKYIADYIEYIMEKYKATAFMALDDSIFINKPWLHDVCDEIIKRKIDAAFYALGGRTDLVDLDILIKMKKAGFRWVDFGVESGSQSILDAMNKKTTVSQNSNAIHLARKAGLSFTINIIFGMPGENKRTLIETKNFLNENDIAFSKFVFCYIMPLPGTELFKYVMGKNIVTDVHSYLSALGSLGNYRYNLSDLSDKAIKNSIEKLLFQKYIDTLKKESNYLTAFKPLTHFHLKRILRKITTPAQRTTIKKIIRSLKYSGNI